MFGILVCATVIVLRIATAYVAGRVHRLRASAEILVFLAAAYFLIGPALKFLGWAHLAEDMEKGLATAWIVCLAFLANGIIRVVVWDGILSDHGRRTVPILITGGVGLMIYLIAILVAMHFVYDEPITGLLATSGAAALILGLAAQSTLKEVFSGVALNATQALRLGDFVEIDGIYGQVYEINWRSIAVKNPHTDSLYIFPNSGVAERTILNFSEPTGRFKYFVHFTVELSAPPELVIRAIAKELENSRFVRRDPKPDFNLLGYTNEGIQIRIRYFFDGDDPWWDAQNEVIMAIWSAMRKHRLRVAINRRWLGSGDEWADLGERTETQFTRQQILDCLKRVTPFDSVPDGELAELAATANVVSLNPPGCFYEPGERSDGLFLVLDGVVALYERAQEPTSHELRIEACRPGELFGLQSFLEGTSRNYLAQAEQFSVVAHLGEEAVRRIISSHADVDGLLRQNLMDRAERRRASAEAERAALLAAQHAGEKRRISQEIRRNVDDLLAQPALHHLLSILSSRVRHEDVLTATMAGAAIVAASRGPVDSAEEDFLRHAMAEADLLRHMDFDHAREIFRRFAADPDVMNKDGSAFAALDRSKEMRNGSDIVYAIATGMSGVHGAPTNEELSALRAIAQRLGVEASAARTDRQTAASERKRGN